MKRFPTLLLLPLFAFSCNKKSENSKALVAKADTLKQKDGTVLTYKIPEKTLVAMQRDQSVYSRNYKKRLMKIAEYYIAGSQRNLVKYHLSKPESVLGYSFEENVWEGVNYTQIGIFNKSGNNLSTLQWLFYEPKSQKLYEFDLNTKKFQEFK